MLYSAKLSIRITSVSSGASGLLFSAGNCAVSNDTAANGGVSFIYEVNALSMGVAVAYSQADNYTLRAEDYN